ncbi:MAG: cell division protein FtsZ [Proteobacteria bacterium]|jgi:cell division protein FtsZ|uniref:cell division protein FtsZ n=1 Tax=Roseateles sp. TaxID=1971397 RepID=UPI000FA7224A|nr:cell division protein FtsZ [Methylibium sp.]MCH8854684.1 cell division protein FtsZ [Pseudomonadota bacterium]RTL17816.1 MAG: cell division protein FtsZ [Burkholderiales bacterium]|mmetsp:Transcript_46803/g.110107  ORF Transcript_46803/g.110107 Transcript_46803/m.110107 type:complete len:414 (-) Transcript_46803:90-1331(-)
MPIEMIEEFDQGTQIKVIGVGGGGGNAVDHMIAQGVQGVEFICANTDAQALNRSKADQLLQLGNSGLGAGAKPEMGKAAAEEAESRIRESIAGANMLFITAGMGGGTGTGAAPVIARVAKEMGVLTVGVVTKPFEFEGSRRAKAADAGLAELEANVDSLIVVLNDKLLDVLGDDVTQDQAFAHANDVLKNAVGGISDIIHIPGLVNVDFEDVKTVMSEPGKAMMGTAQATGPDRATKAAEAAVACPLLEGIDLSGARGVLVLIAASRANFKLSESRNAMNAIKRYASEDAHIIYGTAYDESLGDALRVTVIATGLTAGRARQQAPLQVVQTSQVVRNGTDGMPVLTQAVAVAAPAATTPQANVGLGLGDFANANVPSVWRHGRSGSAAAKVEALSSNGMDEIEIPAFLRKQAD